MRKRGTWPAVALSSWYLLACGCSVRSDREPEIDALSPTSVESSRQAHYESLEPSSHLGTRVSHDPAFDAEIGASNLAPSLEAHLSRAERDPAFSYSLATALHGCSARLSASEQIAAASLERLPEDDRASLLRQIEDEQEHCGDLPNTAVERFELIDRAAAAGIVEAQIAYRAVAADYVLSESVLQNPGAVREYKEKSVHYALRAAASGDGDALYNAYDVLSSPQFGNFDRPKAMAYLLAYQMKTGKGSTLINMESRKLSAHELAMAQDAANVISAGH